MNRSSGRLRLALALLVLTSFTLITLDYRAGHTSPFGAVRSAAGALFGPVQRAVGAAVRPVGSALSSVPHLGRYRGEAQRLQRENEQLRQQLRTSEVARQRAAELDRLLRVAGAGQYRVVPARVVAIGGALGFEWTVTIDAGSRDGLRVDMTVVNGEGLVGRIKFVSAYTSTVLLAIDATSSVGIRLENSEEIGFVSGHGMQPMTLQLLDTQAKVAAGNRLVTLGEPRSSFVSGVPVGAVSAVENTPGSLGRSALVTPYVDFTSVDLVGVVVEPPRTDPRDAVLPPPLPPPPAPSPAPAPPPPAGIPASPSSGPVVTFPTASTRATPRPSRSRRH